MGVNYLDMDVVAVEEKGLYIKDGGDPWKVADHDVLMVRDDDLARAYRDAIGESKGL